MKIKTFHITNEEEINNFIESVVLIEQTPVQITSEDTVVIFYEDTKEGYEKHFVNKMIDMLKRNLMHESIGLHSARAEKKAYEEAGRSSFPEFDETTKKLKNAEVNVEVMEAKIKALEGWTVKPTSKK